MGALLSNKSFAYGATHALAAIFSVAGPILSQQERDFFREADPLGFILFARNCETPDQLRGLTAALKEAVGRDCPVLIDQEGGRVQRLKPPQWTQYPPMKDFGDMAQNDMDRAREQLSETITALAKDLQNAGINVNCAPVLDVLTGDTHDVIGTRGFSTDPEIVSQLGLSVAWNLLAAGITPVMKHIPGHGRATADSHHNLPVVKASLDDLESADFVPFRELARSEVAPALWGMTAHIIYPEIDPDRPVTISPNGINKVIRGGLGFDGFLLSDDVDMKALDPFGDIASRTTQLIEAGCDAALYCHAEMKIMQQIAESVPKLAPKSVERLQNAAEYIKLAV